jgi:hypothetical protein
MPQRLAASARLLTTMLLAIGALVATVLQANAQERTLFNAVAALGDGRAALPDPQRARLVALERGRVHRLVQVVRVEANALAGASVLVPVPQAGTMRLRREQLLERGAGDFTWVGRMQVPSAQSVLVAKGGDVTGVLYLGAVQYALTPLGGGLHAFTRVDQAAFPPDHPRSGPKVAPQSPDLRRGGALPNPVAPAVGPVVIDLLAAYTAEAAAADPNLHATIQLAVDMANAAYTASNAGVQLRLLERMLVTGYSESGKSYNALLSDVTNGTGAMDAVHTRRDAIGADLVALFVNHTSYCGLAWINATPTYAFSVTTHICVAGHTFAHELGHNFGAAHNFAEPSRSPYAYGYGFIPSNQAWATIQSYRSYCGNCPRIGNFSNPSISHLGQATGTAAQENVARVHRERAATIAAFRARRATGGLTVTPATGLSASGSTGTSVAGTMTYTLRNEGSSALDWTASRSQPWVILSSTGGRLAAGASTTLRVSLATGTRTLPSGTHTDTVRITNTTNGQGDTTRSVRVTLQSGPAVSMRVRSDRGLEYQGVAGATHTAKIYYRVRNEGSQSLDWTATANKRWIAVTPTAGTLAPGETARVAVALGVAATSLPAETHTGIVRFRNMTSGFGDTQRSVILELVSPGRPANDNMRAATVISGSGSSHGNTTEATGQPGEPAHFGMANTASLRSVWYRWTAARTGQLILDTEGSNFDTVLAVYTGRSFGSLLRVARNDNANGLRSSRVAIPVVAGRTYMIAIDGKRGATGTYALRWTGR